jgi:hypothetical protein
LGILDWLEGLPLSEWVAQSEVGYPLLLSIHSIGMAAVAGLMLVLDLRVLGVAPQIPISAFRRFMPIAWAGFGLNLISGVLLFNATAVRLVKNWPFLSKMACICAAGVVTWMLWRALKGQGLDRAETEGGATVAVAGQTKALASLSIVLWLLAILFGRLIAYIMDYMILNGL